MAKGRRRGRTKPGISLPKTPIPASKQVALGKRPIRSSATGRCDLAVAAGTEVSRITKQPLCPSSSIARHRGVALQEPAVDQRFTVSAQHVNKYRHRGASARPPGPRGHVLWDSSAVSSAQLERVTLMHSSLVTAADPPSSVGN